MPTQMRAVAFAALWGAAFLAGGSWAILGMGTLGVVPLVGPGHVDSFTVSCGTSATLIQSPFGQVSYRAFVDDAAGADVYFGDASVTTSIGEPVGAGEAVGGNVRAEYCRVAASTETIRVRAMTGSAPSSLIGSMQLTYHRFFSPEMFTARID